MKEQANITRSIFVESTNTMELYKLLRRKELYSNFINRDILVQFKAFESEVGELKEQIDFKNKEEIIKEFGDVIFTLFLITQGLIQKGIIEPEDIKKSILELKNKIYKRSPQLLYGKKESIEKEEELWKQGKN